MVPGHDLIRQICSFAPEDGIFTRDGLADSQPPLLDNTSLAPIKTDTFGKPRKICHQLAYWNRNRRIGSFLLRNLSSASALDGASKVPLLLRKLSPAAHQRFVDYILPALPKHKTFEQTVDILKAIFGEGISTFRKRFRCLQTVKSGHFISYSATVNRRCEEFNIGATKADQFKCLVYVCGLQSPNDAEIRMRLINRMEMEPEKVTLASLVDECNRLVNLRKDTSMVETQEIKAIYQPTNQGNRFKPTDLPKTPCWLCGGVHFVRDCGYSSHRCSMCHQIGHKDGYCACVRPSKQNGGHADKPQRKPAAQGQQGRPWKKDNRGSRNQKPYSTRIVCCRQVQASSGRKFVEVAINGQQAHLQIDSASDISTSARASTASGSQLQLTSQFKAYVTLQGVDREGTIYVTNANLNILGIDWIERFGLWDVPISSVCQAIKMLKGTEIDELKVKYADVFSEQPSVCSCVDVQLSVKDGAKPVFRPKRPVAYGSLQLVEEELDRLEKRGIITPVTYSEWAALIVVVRKADKSVRICGDYSTGLNDVLEPHQYPLPTPAEIFASLAGGQVYSILDMRDAYLLLNVAEPSRKYLTVNTHRGLYQFNRVPFGIKPAPGAFQQVIDTALAGLPSVKAYLDDIIVTGRTIEEHKRNLEEVLRRLQKFGLRLKLEKCKFFERSVKYLGHIVDQNGTRPDPEKTKAIAEMPAPTDVSTLRAFLGAINYYGKYIPHMRNLRYPLDNLLKSSQTKFLWTAECQRSFVTFKRILLSDLALTHYDPSLPIVVSADASNVGLGACIQHVFRNGSRKTVYHVARSLTKAEANYGQIEKEGLALIFAVTRFHRMIFGRHFTLQTDYKLLLAIFGSKKGIPVYAANRLQRWAVTLLNYDFDIEYVRTTEFGNADVLSRLINRCAKPEEDFVIAAVTLEADLDEVLRVTLNSCNLPLSFRTMQVATAKDAILQQVQKHLRSGWPQSKKQLRAEIQPYFEARESLSLVHDCILFGERLVVPTIYRSKVLKLLHTAHPGIERMKALGRSYVYWPNMSPDIRDLVLRCSQCAAAAKAPARAIPQPWPKSTKPFQRLRWALPRPVLPCRRGFVLQVAGDRTNRDHHNHCDDCDAPRDFLSLRNAGEAHLRQRPPVHR
ncbi:uncharacterized protein K02A2.6-like [Culex pipiens pallens]|uniref:uncharacterized protein K02A2.6-like n=1 Tax=Culex pipiens pallens TaxID=42434 RepID=UPI0022AAAB50|nr:uncharacterized protein K02A2.6-like [Culex pipiens pallens]